MGDFAQLDDDSAELLQGGKKGGGPDGTNDNPSTKYGDGSGTGTNYGRNKKN